MDFALPNMPAGPRRVRGELGGGPDPRDLVVWKTIKLGARKTADEYRQALKAAGCRIGDWADEILGKLSFAASQLETEVDLVVLSGGDLGFKHNARYSDICVRALELGLQLCPAAVGPALRLVYGEQPRDEWLRIAMEPLTDSGGYRFIFAVAQDYIALWLSGVDGDPEFLWGTDDRFVFIRRK